MVLAFIFKVCETTAVFCFPGGDCVPLSFFGTAVDPHLSGSLVCILQTSVHLKVVFE